MGIIIFSNTCRVAKLVVILLSNVIFSIYFRLPMEDCSKMTEVTEIETEGKLEYKLHVYPLVLYWRGGNAVSKTDTNGL